MNEDLALLRDTALEAGRLALKLRTAGLTIEHKEGGSPVSYWRENPDRGWEKQA